MAESQRDRFLPALSYDNCGELDQFNNVPAGELICLPCMIRENPFLSGFCYKKNSGLPLILYFEFRFRTCEKS